MPIIAACLAIGTLIGLRYAPALSVMALLFLGAHSAIPHKELRFILPMLPRRHTVWGGLVAPLLWTGGLWALLGVINPVLAARVDWAWFVVSQVAFGLAAGYVVARAAPMATMQTWPLAARAGVESPGLRGGRERER